MMKRVTSSSLWSRLYIDVPEEFAGTVIEKLGQRKGELVNMTPGHSGYDPPGVHDSFPRSDRLPW